MKTRTTPAEQNLNIRRSDLLDCRDDLHAAVGQTVHVILVANPSIRFEDYVVVGEDRFFGARGGAWNNTHTHGIGRGILVKRLKGGRCVTRIDQFPSDLKDE